MAQEFGKGRGTTGACVESVRVENSRKNKNLQDCLMNFNNIIHIYNLFYVLCTLPCILVLFPK